MGRILHGTQRQATESLNENTGLKLAPKKCRFGVRRVEYLGAVVSDGMLSMSEQCVKDLTSVPAPTTVRELRRALGGFSYVQRWLPGLAETAKHYMMRWTKTLTRD